MGRKQPARAAAVLAAHQGQSLLSEERRAISNKRHLDDLEKSNYTEPGVSSSAARGGNIDGLDGDEGAERPTGSRHLRAAAEEGSKRRKKMTTAVRMLLMYSKNYNTLVSEANLPLDQPNYRTAQAKPSRYPPLRLCSVCGSKPAYSCIRCGIEYCDLTCRATHDESRCERRIG
ncbi:uncharacterized protein L969DRAFT_93946 [Mixia osmundae IAM 14324]|uniref:HIT-type domain-containing protein n=1 Tax=Mixia osmundae (strain CBS 9802 / IAM 14324 / JCM 22182 / KY 12970) TaxID=764103 RepID=G7E8L8_MIXOS|nr:uncharacterized protein L969DRAFT_93946 [Mixia osmundae IAM 14324]KEI40120.1 hypothetical protein L969DRAFT_93946 [Mixia osmundae IAM 14324]GAA99486.1 hypothetical protein E5Q_06186 [Mixia osmundae IAM 14324]